MMDLQTKRIRKTPWNGGKYMKAGLLAGLVAAVLNNLLYIIIINIVGKTWVLAVAVSILVASLIPNLLAALLYFGLSRLTHRARHILTIAVGIFVLISILPHLGIGPAPSSALEVLPEGFELVTIPLHIVFGLTAITLIPWLAAKNENNDLV